jgi:hypothetical protein
MKNIHAGNDGHEFDLGQEGGHPFWTGDGHAHPSHDQRSVVSIVGEEGLKLWWSP